MEREFVKREYLKQVYESAGCYFLEYADSSKYYYDKEDSPRYEDSILMDEN
jgi:hypothetical protein